eukprot:SAG31_NODE_5925_length_2254_cov_2.642691_4_plen_221_part_00
MASHLGTHDRLQRSQASPSHCAARPPAVDITDIKCYTVGTRQNGERLMVGSGRALIIVKVKPRICSGFAEPHRQWTVHGHRCRCCCCCTLTFALPTPQVETSAGYHGWGEAGLLGRELAVAGALTHFKEMLVGRDARRIGASWQEMYRSGYFEGGRVLTAAISAIDMALHDLVARSLGIPVYMLLGGAQRDRVPCFGSTQIIVPPYPFSNLNAVVAQALL